MVSVALDGATIDHLVLDEDITVRVGRASVLNRGEPGSASLELYLSQWVDVRYNSLLVITDGGVRFSGRVTEVMRGRWEEAPGGGWMMLLRLQAAGPLAGWGRTRVGDEPWPAEAVSVRAQRIADLVGQPLNVQGGAPVVAARDVDSRPAIDLLEELAADCAGWLFDHAGQTYLQSLETRRLADPQERWDDQTTTWTAWVGTWDEQTQTSAAAPLTIHLPPGAVLFAPSPELAALIANRVRVLYGAPDAEGLQLEASGEDAASIAEFGVDEVRIATRLQNAGDAALRVQLTLERAAQPQWHLPRVEVARELLDAATASLLDNALPGAFVEVADLPQPGPFQVFQGVLEGWTDQWSWDDAADAVLRTTTLHLSDMRWSFAVLTWDGITPDTLHWADIDATWDQMLTADDLEVLRA